MQIEELAEIAEMWLHKIAAQPWVRCEHPEIVEQRYMAFATGDEGCTTCGAIFTPDLV